MSKVTEFLTVLLKISIIGLLWCAFLVVNLAIVGTFISSIINMII